MEVAKYPGAVPIDMLQGGASPMSAPLMPAPMGGPNALLFMGGAYNQTGFMAGEVMPKNNVVPFARKTIHAGN